MSRHKRELKEQRGNVLLIEPEKGFHLTHRDNPPGEPVRFRGEFVHLCVQDGDDLLAVEAPLNPGDPPERYYRARYWPEVRSMFGKRQTWMEKLDKGLWLGALGILGFLLFLIIASVQ